MSHLVHASIILRQKETQVAMRLKATTAFVLLSLAWSATRRFVPTAYIALR
jgi:hypothetical protein